MKLSVGDGSLHLIFCARCVRVCVCVCEGRKGEGRGAHKGQSGKTFRIIKRGKGA